MVLKLTMCCTLSHSVISLLWILCCADFFCACCAFRGAPWRWAGFALTGAADSHTPAADWQSAPADQPWSSPYLLPDDFASYWVVTRPQLVLVSLASSRAFSCWSLQRDLTQFFFFFFFLFFFLFLCVRLLAPVWVITGGCVLGGTSEPLCPIHGQIIKKNW